MTQANELSGLEAYLIAFGVLTGVVGAVWVLSLLWRALFWMRDNLPPMLATVILAAFLALIFGTFLMLKGHAR